MDQATHEQSELQQKETQEAIEIAERLKPTELSHGTDSSQKRYRPSDDLKRIFQIYNKYYAEDLSNGIKKTMSIGCAPCGPKVVNYFLALKEKQA